MKNKKLYTQSEASAYLGISRVTLWKYRKENRITPRQVKGSTLLRYAKSDLDKVVRLDRGGWNVVVEKKYFHKAMEGLIDLVKTKTWSDSEWDIIREAELKFNQTISDTKHTETRSTC